MLKLLVKTDKKFNELTTAELRDVHWASVSADEFEHIDADTYRKLNATARAEVNAVVDVYSSRPVEYWNEVLKHKVQQAFVENFLGKADDMKAMYNLHKQLFDLHFSSKRLFDLGLMPFSEYVKEDRYDALVNHHNYYILLNPEISESEYQVKLDTGETVLELLIENMRDHYSLDDYPILLSNEVLTAAGGYAVPDFTEANLSKYDACSDGRRFLKTWKITLGIEKDDVLTWDAVVKYIRENPEVITGDSGESIIEYLNWWWEASISYN